MKKLSIAWWVKHFWDCVWSLGPHDGFRYWRLSRRAYKDPTFADSWVQSLEQEARYAEARDQIEAQLLKDFAQALKKQNEYFKSQSSNE